MYFITYFRRILSFQKCVIPRKDLNKYFVDLSILNSVSPILHSFVLGLFGDKNLEIKSR